MFVSKSNRTLLLGYALLFVATVLFDQSTKFHAERNYMTWSHEDDLRSYRSDRHRVAVWGVSPALARELKLGLGEDGTAAQRKDIEVTPHWLEFNLTYVRNPGAAWGAFANAPATVRLWGFYAVTLFVSGLIVYLFKSSHPGQRLARTAFTLILAGAAGNFVDRLLLRYVIDWIHFQWRLFGWEYSFPVFNWADVVINVGIGLMVVDMFLQERAMKKVSVPNPVAV